MQEAEVLIVNARTAGDWNWGWPSTLVLTLCNERGDPPTPGATAEGE